MLQKYLFVPECSTSSAVPAGGGQVKLCQSAPSSLPSPPPPQDSSSPSSSPPLLTAEQTGMKMY